MEQFSEVEEMPGNGTSSSALYPLAQELILLCQIEIQGQNWDICSIELPINEKMIPMLLGMAPNFSVTRNSM